MREIELRRHAARERERDALSAEGRAQAEDAGRTLRGDYGVVFVSPAKRAAETVAWFLRTSGQPLPPHAVVPGLGSEREDEWRAAARAAGSSRIDAIRAVNPGLVEVETERLASMLRELLDRIPDGGVALAVGHSPLIEAAVHGVTGEVLEPLGECEGVSVVADGRGGYEVREHRR